MPIINKQPPIVKREYAIEERRPARRREFTLRSSEHAGLRRKFQALTKVCSGMPNLSAGRSNNRGHGRAAAKTPRTGRRHDPENPNLQELCRLPPGSGDRNGALFQLPFPAENVFLQLMALRAPSCTKGFSTLQPLLVHNPLHRLFDCPVWPVCFGLTVHKKIRAGKLPPYFLDPRKRMSFS